MNHTQHYRGFGVLGLLLAGLLSGCGGQTTPPAPANGGTNAPVPPAVTQVEKATPTPPAPPGAKPTPMSNNDPLNQPFEEATHQMADDDQKLPPPATKGGKSLGKIRDEITRKGGLWEQVKFVTPAGKRLRYSAILKTALGDLVMELYPEHAPNHVRNFVTLARAGYYDGLSFDRTVTELSGEKKVEYILTGCPLGTEETGISHLGYWLHPEIKENLKHEVGTVAAWHTQSYETAACKFYIALGEMPVADGHYTIFGKITHGLDVARTIHSRPVVVRTNGASTQATDRPVEPVVIREVTIRVSEN